MTDKFHPKATPATVAPSHGVDKRLMLQSRWLSWLFFGLFLAASAEVALWVFAMLFRVGSVAGMQNGGFALVLPLPPLHETLSPYFIPVSSLPLWQSMLATVLLAARLLPGLFILWHLRTLFRLYSQGKVFSPDNARQIRLIAFALLGYAAVPFFTHGVLFLVDMTTTVIKMEIRQADALMLGLVLLTMARVMKFGHEIESDREGFV